MICLLRIDERLLHGMVAVSWTSRVQPDVIVIANDRAATDNFFSATLELARPAGVMMRIYEVKEAIEKLTSTSLRTLNVFLITESLEDAETIIEGIEDLNPVKEINVSIAGVIHREGLIQVIPQLYLNENDFSKISSLVSKGKHVFLQAVPTSRTMEFPELKKIFEK